MKRCMASIIFAIFCGVQCLGFAETNGIYENHPYEFIIEKVAANYFTINEQVPDESLYQLSYPGNISKNDFKTRTNYVLFDKNGWQATGNTRMVSLGTIYSWATDIDVYDTTGVKIALIDGSIATLESAKFNIYSYDQAGKAILIGVALASEDFKHFSITTENDYLPIADLIRNKSSNTWKVQVSNPGVIDDRVIRVFAGFIVDYQNKFI